MLVSSVSLWGAIIIAGAILLCLPMNVFLTVYSVLMACMTASMIQTMMNYQRSLRQPEANPITWRERLLPMVRSMGQPLVAVIPMLFAGMLLGGVSFWAAMLAVLLLTATSFVANISAGILALWIAIWVNLK